MGKGNGIGIGNGEKTQETETEHKTIEGRIAGRIKGNGRLNRSSEMANDQVDSREISEFSHRKGGGDSDLIFENLVWMNSVEAARYLRKSYGALRVMVHRGYLQPRMFHRRWYFKRIELDRLIENSAW